MTEICRRLDGLPLAIELAAARLHTLTLNEVAAGLARSHELLTGGRRTTARHRSLAAAIAWSYDLLAPDAQVMFDAVSQFQSPFLPAAAADVLGVERNDALTLLSGLVERSLVHRVGDRYRVYESLRQLGAEHLRRVGTVAEVRERHARHHAAYAALTKARLRVPGDVGVLRELDASLADLRLTERWFAEHGTVEERLSYALDLRDYGFYRMRPEVLTWAEVAADAAVAAGTDLHAAGDAYAAASLGAWNRGNLARGTELVELGARHGEGGGGGTRLLRAREPRTPRTDPRRARRGARPPPGCGRQPPGRAGPLLPPGIDRQRAARAGLFRRPAALRPPPRTSGPSSPPPPRPPQPGAGTPSARCSCRTTRRSRPPTWRGPSTSPNAVAPPSSRWSRGASAASIEARQGDPQRAIDHYRQLLELGQRAGDRVLQWTMLRSVAELLVRVGDHASAATLLGAVTSPGSGHQVFGADLDRLTAVRSAVFAALGDTVADAGIAQGSSLDDDAAVAVALGAFAALSVS